MLGGIVRNHHRNSRFEEKAGTAMADQRGLESHYGSAMSTAPVLLPVAEEFRRNNGMLDLVFVGKGAYKETYKVTTGAGEVRALKLLDPSKCNVARSEREINAMRRCNFPLIAKLYEYGTFDSSVGKYQYLLEEFLDGGSLSDRIAHGRLSPESVRNYGGALARAIGHMKDLNLVHRDIKPDNIMFRSNDPGPVLVDFGLVRDLSESSLTQTWLPQGPGSPYYSAAEQLNNEKSLIGWRTDQFSLGVVLGLCLTGAHPFTANSMTMPETVAAVAMRNRCSQSFREQAKAQGLDNLIRMLEPWPILRYPSPQEMIESFAL